MRFILSCFLIIYSVFSYADQDVKNLIGGYGQSDMAKSQLVAGPNDGPLIISQDNAQSLYLPYPTNPFAIEQSLLGLTKYFSPPSSASPDDVLTNNILTFGPPGTPPPSERNLFTASSQNEEELKKTTPFTNIDLNSLIGPLVYKDPQRKAADNFIAAIAGLNNPYPVMNLTEYANAKSSTGAASAAQVAALANSDDDVLKYLNDLRLYAAAQSVGLSNLYQIYAARVPTNVQEKNPALYQALQGIQMPNASALQVEQYLATRRLTDPKWAASLVNDTPAALLRQIAILLAENLAMNYNTRLAIERLTAAQSVSVLLQTQNFRPILDQDVSTLKQKQKQK